MDIRVLRLSENAILPSSGSHLSAGFDLFSAYDMVIPAKSKGVVETDIAIELPEGCCARIASQTELTLEYGVEAGGGVIGIENSRLGIPSGFIQSFGKIIFDKTW
uniref:dUTP diphosphatase n=1 Tax=Albugo laibachii Nc14 TaxID=890382 RepID=F0WZN6_9STRA|nr:PREDICTED: similar to dUTPase putative [Albugo laibachii Nc14]|eukprot:CCA26962.1 PREDICTED: similar to dUTPase putative [Albugo laibachii Nc14]